MSLMRRRGGSNLAWAAGLAGATLCGCAVGPDFKPPSGPATIAYSAGPIPRELPPMADHDHSGQRFVENARLSANWWTAFKAPALDALVAEALSANPDLRSAEAALRQARELSLAQQGALWPSVDLGYQGQRARGSAALSPPLADNSALYTLHTAQVTVTYPLDVFGGVRRQIEQTQAQVAVQRFQVEAARTSLVANVIQAAVQEASLRRQVEATRQAIAAIRQTRAVTWREVRLGELGGADLSGQDAALAQAEQTLPPLEKSLAQQRAALAILLGREPAQGPPSTLNLGDLTLPADLPLGVPSDLVRQRPDILAAEANLHAASAAVGVATAARLPSLSLQGVIGGAGTKPTEMFARGDALWSLTAGLAQPLFQGGALLHRQRGAEAGFDQARAQYRSTVLAALEGVSDTLDALQSDARALQAAEAADRAAARSLALAQRQRDLGQTTAVPLLAAQAAQAQADAALAAAQAARYVDTVALFQALGGGWWSGAVETPGRP